MRSIKGLMKYVFGRCAYCDNLLRNGGGRGRGTPHRVFDFNAGHDITQYACMTCEMEFDDE